LRLRTPVPTLAVPTGTLGWLSKPIWIVLSVIERHHNLRIIEIDIRLLQLLLVDGHTALDSDILDRVGVSANLGTHFELLEFIVSRTSHFNHSQPPALQTLRFEARTLSEMRAHAHVGIVLWIHELAPCQLDSSSTHSIEKLPFPSRSTP
jgi:hypothetical protein